MKNSTQSIKTPFRHEDHFKDILERVATLTKLSQSELIRNACLGQYVPILQTETVPKRGWGFQFITAHWTSQIKHKCLYSLHGVEPAWYRTLYTLILKLIESFKYPFREVEKVSCLILEDFIAEMLSLRLMTLHNLNFNVTVRSVGICREVNQTLPL